MEFDPALRQELMTITAFGNRVYPLTAPDASKLNGVPYLIYVSNDGLYDKGLDGYFKGKEVQVELNILANSYKEMKAITKDVVALIISFEQRKIGNNGPFIQELTYQTPIPLYEEQPKLFRSVVEFTAFYEEG